MTQNESIVFKAADALSDFGNKHCNHPLALQLGVAIFEYIEIKAKAKEIGDG